MLVTKLLDKLPLQIHKEPQFPEYHRTVSFLFRTITKAQLLCLQQHFSPQIASETYLTLLHEEFKNEPYPNDPSPWLSHLLKNYPFSHIVARDLVHLGWTQDEIGLLLEQVRGITQLDLSGALDLDLTKVHYAETLRDIILPDANTTLTEKFGALIKNSCPNLRTVKIQ